MADLITSRGVIGRFYQTLEAEIGSSWVDSIAMRFDSDQAIETYPWLGQAPAMREWIGGRQAKDLAENAFLIANKRFEATLAIDVNDIRRDKTGQIMIRVDDLATRAAEHPAKLLSTAINVGTSTTCYDGQYFFDTDHVEGASGTQSNSLTLDIGTPTAPTPAEMETAILTCIQGLLGLKDNEGEPLNSGARSFLVMTPPGMLRAALSALSLPMLVDGSATRSGLQLGATGGVGDFTVRPAFNPRLTATDRIYVFRADGRVKPFIHQVELDTEVKAVAEGSEEEFREDRHLYGVKAMRNVGYGYWQYATTMQFT